MLKWKGGSLDRGGRAGKGEASRGGGGSGGVWAVLPRCSIPGTNKGAKPELTGGEQERASVRTAAGFLQLGHHLVLVYCPFSYPNWRKM